MTWPRRIAITMSVLSGALIVTAAVVLGRFMTPIRLAYFVGGVSFSVVANTLGIVTAKRRPHNVVGPLLCWFGFNIPFFISRDIYWWTMAQPDTLPWVNWLNAVTWEAGMWVEINLALLLLFFPDGKLPSARWRWVPPALLVAMAVTQVLGTINPSEYQQIDRLPRPLAELSGPPVEIAGYIAFASIMLLLIACAASLFIKFRKSQGVGRAQIKWMALVGVALPAALVGCWLEYLVMGRASVFSAAAWGVVYVGVPTAAGIAMLRHDLYDIDKAIAATVTYGGLTALLLGIYTATSFGAGVLLGGDSVLVATGTTALCATALSPVRKRLARWVDRRFYPLRQAAMSAIEELHSSIHAGDARPEQLEQVLRAALRDPMLALGFLVPGGNSFVDPAGRSVDSAGSTPIVVGEVQVGILVPATGSASRDLLRQVAKRSAVLVEMVRLRFELSGALREVEASRSRLVQAGDKERQRLERDLHDGAQQRLVSLGMNLRLAQRHLSDGSVEMNGLIDQSVAELATAVSELRQIAHGLRPSSLDEGLTSALATLTRSLPVPIDIEVTAGRIPEEVATTAYFVASEAVTNAVKHAGAGRIGVFVAAENGSVKVRIHDDGHGGAIVRAGSGLSGLKDRVVALGGSLTVDSRPGAGTTIEALLPCGS